VAARAHKSSLRHGGGGGGGGGASPLRLRPCVRTPPCRSTVDVSSSLSRRSFPSLFRADSRAARCGRDEEAFPRRASLVLRSPIAIAHHCLSPQLAAILLLLLPRRAGEEEEALPYSGARVAFASRESAVARHQSFQYFPTNFLKFWIFLHGRRKRIGQTRRRESTKLLHCVKSARKEVNFRMSVSPC